MFHAKIRASNYKKGLYYARPGIPERENILAKVNRLHQHKRNPAIALTDAQPAYIPGRPEHKPDSPDIGRHARYKQPANYAGNGREAFKRVLFKVSGDRDCTASSLFLFS